MNRKKLQKCLLVNKICDFFMFNVKTKKYKPLWMLWIDQKSKMENSGSCNHASSIV